MTGKSLELSARKLAGNRETTAGRSALQPLVNGGQFTGTCYATRQPTRSSFALKGLGRTYPISIAWFVANEIYIYPLPQRTVAHLSSHCLDTVA
jgi:hypothetical protein